MTDTDNEAEAVTDDESVEMPGNFRWFDEQKQVGGSAVPFGEDVEGLRILGVGTVISLIPDDQFPLFEEFAVQLEKQDIDHHTIDIPNLGTPTEKQITEFLETINTALDSGRVLIHCVGGKGRTGTMAGIYLLSTGVPFDEMVTKVKYVESQDQVDCLVNFSLAQSRKTLDRGHLERLAAESGFVDLYGPKGKGPSKVVNS